MNVTASGGNAFNLELSDALASLMHGSSAADAGELLVNLLSALSKSQVLLAIFDDRDRLRVSNAAFRAALHVSQCETPTWGEFMKENYNARRGVVIGETKDIDGWITSVNSRRGRIGLRESETKFHDGRWFVMKEVVLLNRW